jgi:Spy/CpxP family protein refolding chaperone
MKNPRKFVLGLCVIALGLALPATVIRAEDGPPPSKKEPGPKGERGEMMKEKLGLTDAQAEQIKKIHEDERTQLRALRENEDLPKEEKRAELRKIREATKTKVDALLTPEQKTKADKMREEMKERMEERRAEKGEKGPKGEKGSKGDRGPKGDK